MRTRSILALLLMLAASVSATTLERLSVDQMIQKSTAIVRAKVTGSRSAVRNGAIYTYYKLQVAENLKATTPASVEVAVPGGSVGRVMQSVAGAPELRTGSEYVMFLWTSPSGLTQIIGLSQGAFDVHNANGVMVLQRAPVTEQMLDPQGRVVTDRGVTLNLNDLRVRAAEANTKKEPAR